MLNFFLLLSIFISNFYLKTAQASVCVFASGNKFNELKDVTSQEGCKQICEFSKSSHKQQSPLYCLWGETLISKNNILQADKDFIDTLIDMKGDSPLHKKCYLTDPSGKKSDLFQPWKNSTRNLCSSACMISIQKFINHYKAPEDLFLFKCNWNDQEAAFTNPAINPDANRQIILKAQAEASAKKRQHEDSLKPVITFSNSGKAVSKYHKDLKKVLIETSFKKFPNDYDGILKKDFPTFVKEKFKQIEQMPKAKGLTKKQIIMTLPRNHFKKSFICESNIFARNYNFLRKLIEENPGLENKVLGMEDLDPSFSIEATKAVKFLEDSLTECADKKVFDSHLYFTGNKADIAPPKTVECSLKTKERNIFMNPSIKKEFCRQDCIDSRSLMVKAGLKESPENFVCRWGEEVIKI